MGGGFVQMGEVCQILTIAFCDDRAAVGKIYHFMVSLYFTRSTNKYDFISKNYSTPAPQ